MLLLIERSHQCSQSRSHGFPNFDFNNYVWKGYNIGIRVNIYTCLKYVFVVLLNGPPNSAFTSHFVFDRTFASMLSILEPRVPNSENFGSQKQPAPRSRNKLVPNVSSVIPNLGTTGPSSRFSNLPTNASQSWNLGFPVLGTSGSQTFEPMLPNLGTSGSKISELTLPKPWHRCFPILEPQVPSSRN